MNSRRASWLVALAMGAVVVLWVAPAIMRVRAVADADVCASRIRGLPIACHNWHGDFAAFPKASYGGKAISPERRIGWTAEAQPYFINYTVRFDRDKPWDDE